MKYAVLAWCENHKEWHEEDRTSTLDLALIIVRRLIYSGITPQDVVIVEIKES